MNQNEQISYVEFPAKDIEAAKAFFSAAFGWGFVDYGPEYVSFSDAGLAGGFYQSDLIASTDTGSALIVLYSKDLNDSISKIENAGGTIIKPVYSFPGGRRFHFADPNGSEYAVWSDVE